MYIQPNSTVSIIKGCPLDNTYQRSIRFESEIAQNNYFQGKRKFLLEQVNYQRANTNSIRVEKSVEDLYDCNYIAFRNTSFGNKWFYAFINEVNYINNKTSEIVYQIDVIQTWWFDFDMGMCFVEREHTETDNLGEHIVTENFNELEMYVNDKDEFVYPLETAPNEPMFTLLIFYVPKTTDNEGNIIEGFQTTGNIYNGIYMGCQLETYDMLLGEDFATTVSGINEKITEIISSGGNIVSLVQVPFRLWVDTVQAQGGIPQPRNKTINQTKSFIKSDRTRYTPKNKKMYTSPFMSIKVSNNAGATQIYSWEDFALFKNTSDATFVVQGSPIPTPELSCYPLSYKGLTSDYENAITLTDFPNPPFSVDSFAAWWGANKEKIATSFIVDAVKRTGTMMFIGATAGMLALTSGASVTASAFTASNAVVEANGAGELPNYSYTLMDLVKDGVSAKYAPDSFVGQTNIPALRILQNRIGFTFYQMCVKGEIAMIIDNFLSTHGYAIKDIKIPNIKRDGASLRPYWNYVQTVGAIILPKSNRGLPSDASRDISAIFDNGITFWTHRADMSVGDYSKDNSPSV